MALVPGFVRSRGQPSHNRLPGKERDQIVNLLQENYYDFGPTLASEKLEENHGFDRDPKTIRSLMTAEGLWRPRRRRKESPHRSWRQRRSALGELVQFDGSYERWFEERAQELCLLAAIDDATGKILHAGFAEHEGVFPVFDFWRQYLSQHG